MELDTASGATRSGFTRPSIVGPWALKNSTVLSYWDDPQQSAPTASAAGDDAGSTTL
jgi:hypothetical protein